MVKIKPLLCLLLLGVLAGSPLQGQMPKTDFAAQGVALDSFFARVQAKISYSFSESARHFTLIWKSAGNAGEKMIREKAAELGRTGEQKVRATFQSAAQTLESTCEKGKKEISNGMEKARKKGSNIVSSAVEEKKYP